MYTCIINLKENWQKLSFNYHLVPTKSSTAEEGRAMYLVFVVDFLSFCRIKFVCIDLAMCYQVHKTKTVYEPRSEKTGLQGFRPGPTQTRLYNHRRWLEH